MTYKLNKILKMLKGEGFAVWHCKFLKRNRKEWSFRNITGQHQHGNWDIWFSWPYGLKRKLFSFNSVMRSCLPPLTIKSLNFILSGPCLLAPGLSGVVPWWALCRAAVRSLRTQSSRSCTQPVLGRPCLLGPWLTTVGSLAAFLRRQAFWRWAAWFLSAGPPWMPPHSPSHS